MMTRLEWCWSQPGHFREPEDQEYQYLKLCHQLHSEQPANPHLELYQRYLANFNAQQSQELSIKVSINQNKFYCFTVTQTSELRRFKMPETKLEYNPNPDY